MLSASVSLDTVPLESLADAMYHVAKTGVDPLDILAAAVFGTNTAIFETEPTLVEGACIHGHLWTEENTYRRPNGWRVCRACARNYRPPSRKNRYAKSRVPCVHCGALCTAPEHKRKGGTSFARCRSCYLAEVRERSKHRFKTKRAEAPMAAPDFWRPSGVVSER